MPYWEINCLVPFLQIIFLFCLNYDGIQQIFKGFGWIITIKYYFCSVKNDKNMKLNRIRAVLEDKGISQTWLAKKLGRSFSTVNAYVCNRTQPNLTTLLEIAQLLSVDMKELITDDRAIMGGKTTMV